LVISYHFGKIIEFEKKYKSPLIWRSRASLP